MSNEENELLKLYESQYTGRLFEKANSYLLERNALFDEREKLYNLLDKIKEYCNKQIKIAEENIIESEKWLKVEECHLQAKQDIHIGKIIKRENEKILELLEEIE